MAEAVAVWRDSIACSAAGNSAPLVLPADSAPVGWPWSLEGAPCAVKKEVIAAVRDELAAAVFDEAKLEALVQSFAQSQGVGLGDVVNALRVSLTGKSVGFGLYETLVILGKERSLARIDRALARV